MAIKKKIKRIREAKNNMDASTKDLEETEPVETQVDGELAEKLVKLY